MGLMQTLFVIYMFISIVLFLTTIPGSGIDLGVGDSPLINYVNTKFFFKSDTDPVTGKTTVDLNHSEGFMQTIPRSTGTGGIEVGGVLHFITDGLGLMFAFIILLINMTTMPIQIFLSMSGLGMPIELTYLIAVPMSLMMILGIIFLIRGYKG